MHASDLQCKCLAIDIAMSVLPSAVEFFASDTFRELLGELGRFESELSRHGHPADINLVECLLARTEEFRECLVILTDLAQQLPTAPSSIELLEGLRELVYIFQEKESTYLSFLERSEEESSQNLLLPDLSFTVLRQRRVQGRGGRPFIFVSRAQLEAFLDMGFKYVDVAKILCVSERTLLRRRAELGLPVGRSSAYSAMDDNELDEMVSDLMQV